MLHEIKRRKTMNIQRVSVYNNQRNNQIQKQNSSQPAFGMEFDKDLLRRLAICINSGKLVHSNTAQNVSILGESSSTKMTIPFKLVENFKQLQNNNDNLKVYYFSTTDKDFLAVEHPKYLCPLTIESKKENSPNDLLKLLFCDNSENGCESKAFVNRTPQEILDGIEEFNNNPKKVNDFKQFMQRAIKEQENKTNFKNYLGIKDDEN